MSRQTTRSTRRLPSSDYEQASFVSEDNTNVDLVQFAMKTEGISIPDEEEEDGEEQSETETEDLWTRVKDLFKKH